MTDDPKYGPSAQTPQQRTRILAQMQLVYPHPLRPLTGYTQGLYARYVVGELSWQHVCALRDAPSQLPGV